MNSKKLSGPILLSTLLIFSHCLKNAAFAEEEGHDHKGHGQKEDGHEEEGHGGHDEGGHSEEGHEETSSVELEWEKAEKAGIQFVAAKSGEVRSVLTLNGEVALNGDTIVHVSPRFPGVIKRIEKNLGESVKAGDLLAVIQSNESLTTYELRAEVDGVVIEKDATRGEFVRDEKLLFTIADLKNVWINAAVYPEDLSRISLGTPVVITAKSSNLSQKGNITYLRPSLSELTRSALVRVVISNQDHKWLPGMFVGVGVLIDPKGVDTLIPASSVISVGNKPSVFIKKKSPDGDEGFEVRQIEVGLSDGENIEVKSGLETGDTVAAGNTFILKAELGKGSAAHEH